MNEDSIYEKIQNKNLNVAGPQEKLWDTLELANKEGQSSTYSIENLPWLVQQSVLLIGLTNVTFSYPRRLNALDGTMNSSTQAKSIMKTKSDLFQKDNKDLFGKDFGEQISETLKTYKNSKELLASTVFKEAHGVTRLFRRGLSQNQNKLCWGIFSHSSKSSSAVSTTATVANGITGT